MSTIIIAEDDAAMRAFLTTSLTRAGHAVHAFSDGLSAFDYIGARENPIDLLLTDIVMPGMDGIELATRSKSVRPDLKIMYITGFGTAEAAGVGGQVLAKPIHLSQLLNEVTRQLDNSDAA